MVWDGTDSTASIIKVSGGSFTTTNSLNLGFPTTLAETTFVAPPSGRVTVVGSAYVTFAGTGSTNLILFTVEVRAGGTIRSGTVVYAADIHEGAGGTGVAGGLMKGSAIAFVDGLTPGSTYNTYFAVLTGSAGAQTNGIANSRLKVAPLP